jgi:phage terminase small subunit
MALTLRQSRFIDEYLANGGRAKAAAVMAGYAEGSAKQRGYELLRRPEVAMVISQRESERREGLDIDSGALVAALWGFVRGAEAGKYPAGVGVRAAAELARLGGLYRTITETREEKVLVTMTIGPSEAA